MDDGTERLCCAIGAVFGIALMVVFFAGIFI